MAKTNFVFEPGMPVAKIQKFIKLGMYELVSGELKPGNTVTLKKIGRDNPSAGKVVDYLLK